MDAADNENVVHGPELLELIPNGSFGKTIYNRLQEFYSLPIAFIDAATRRNISYATVFEQSLRLAHSLQKYGITKNDVIAISSENSIHYALPLIAGLWIGATVTLFNPQYTRRELSHVANISKPKVIFCTEMSLQPILQVQRDLKCVQKIITIDDVNRENDVESMGSFLAANCRDYKGFEPVDVDSHDVALIMYSSGTTGLPKGVMITHRNLNVTNTFFRDPRYFMQRDPGTVTTLGLAPFFHAMGCIVFVSALLFGTTVLVISKFEGRTFLKAIQDFKLKYFAVVPPIITFLLKSELVDQYDLSHLEMLTSGAAPLSKHAQEQLLKRFKNVSVLRQAYGLTEATVTTMVSPIGASKAGSSGKILPATSAKVIDINTGKSLGPGQKGELYFKGPQIMKGYAGDTRSTDSAIDSHGWLRTGDVGYYDEDGYFYIVDRVKELIKYKGYQVPPAELEAILLEHPQIADAAVIGIPDEQAGELPLAFVVKKPGGDLTEQRVKDYVTLQVSPYKQLRGGVRFVHEIPKSPSGKILRKDLHHLLLQKSKL